MKRKRTFEAADGERMSEEGTPRPAMQLKACGLERERVHSVGAQIERHLVRGLTSGAVKG